MPIVDRHRLRSVRSRGFAVVLALLLVSFLVLLLTSLTVLSRVEFQAGDRALNQALARAHALFALNRALGELTAVVGPDTRVTARAESVGLSGSSASSVHPLTIGAWDTLATDPKPRWLVSGQDGDASGGSVVLWKRPWQGAIEAGGGSEYAPGAAPTVDLGTLRAGGRVGTLAWWADDESLKASLAVPDLIDQMPLPEVPASQVPNQRLRYRQFIPAAPFLGHIDPDNATAWDFTYGPHRTASDFVRWSNALAASDSHEEVALRVGKPWPAAGSSAVANAVHTTPLALGVLADTVRGGLKADLSFLERGDAATLATATGDARLNADLQAYLRYRGDPTVGATLREGTEPTDAGAPSFPIEPIVTEFTFTAGLAFNSSSRRLTLYYYVFADFWNPYSYILQTTPRSSPDYRIRIRQLPRVSLEVLPTTPTGTGYSAVVDLPEINADLDIFNPMPPGQVLMATTPSGRGGTSSTGTWHQTLDYILPTGITTANTGSARFSESTVLIEVYDISGGSERLIKTFQLEGYEPYTINYSSSVPILRSTTSMSRSSLANPNLVFAYHFRLYDEHLPQLSSPTDLERAIDLVGLPDRVIRVLPEGRDPDACYGIAFDKPNLYSRSEVFIASDFFADSVAQTSTGSTLGIDRLARVRDLPTLLPTSVGDLRFLAFKDAPWLGLGRPQSGAPNDWFDRYFLSGETAAAPGSLPAVPHQHRLQSITPADRGNHLDGVSSARHFLTRGAFNLNATRAEAWRSVAEGLFVPGFRSTYESGAGVRQRDLKRAFFGLPFGAHHRLDYNAGGTRYRYQTATELANLLRTGSQGFPTNRTHPAFTQGVRELTEEHATKLATEIATRTATKLRAQGRPFRGLEEFIDSGIVAEALLEAGVNGTGDNTIPRGAPAHIGQEAVMAQIAPVLSPRGDTFRVRFYGDVRNTVTDDLSGRAYGEAVVQRLPDPVIPGSNTRRLQVVSFRWLSPEEI